MKRIFLILVALAFIIPLASAVEIVCTPAAGPYNETMYISCSFPDYSVLLGGDAANQSMRWYWTNTGRYGTVFKEITNPDNSHPFNGGWQTGFFQPPHTNFTPGVILMTYGTTANPNTQTQNLYTSVATGFAGFYSYGTYTFNYSIAQPPTANFTGSPLIGAAPLYVSFTDTSENETGTCVYNWSITPASGISVGATGTLEDHTTMFSTEGNYTVSHGVSCDGVSDIETKTDYIMVLNGSVLGTLYITAINSLNGYPIQGATLNLNDVENGTWANATTTTGTSQITGIKTHTVNVYASSPGFANNDKLGIPISNVYDSILMFPENRSNVSAGNVTLFVSVYEGDDHSKPIPNAGVNVIGPNGGSGQYTNGGGTAQFTVANKTTYLVDVQATGHRGATASVYSGTGSGGSASVTVTVYLDKNTVTPTATQTTLPGGGTPTPTVTVLPGCELNPSSPECQAAQNNEAMAWISANGLGLVQFFVMCFIVFMVKGLGRK